MNTIRILEVNDLISRNSSILVKENQKDTNAKAPNAKDKDKDPTHGGTVQELRKRGKPPPFCESGLLRLPMVGLRRCRLAGADYRGWSAHDNCIIRHVLLHEGVSPNNGMGTDLHPIHHGNPSA